jgi:hypothetical protein
MTEEPEPDYITVIPTVSYEKYLVVVMRLHRGEYIQTRVSQALPKIAADALAKAWATATRLEIR